MFDFGYVFSIRGCFLILALAYGSSATAQEATALVAPTFEQSIAMKRAFGAQISPDGRFVVYSESRADWKANRYRSQYWLRDLDRQRTFQLTFGDTRSSSAAWSPDSHWLSLLRSVDGKSQLFLISPFGGEAWQLSASEVGVGSYRWSPNGKRIAFSARPPRTKDEKEEDERGEYFEVDEAQRASQLWLIDLPGTIGGKPVEATQLTKSDTLSFGSPAWSPDGTRLAVTATEAPKHDWSSSQVYVVAVDAPETMTALTHGTGPNGSPTWSPDGEQIAYTTANGEEFFYYTNREIAVVPATGGSSRILSKDFDENPRIVGWSADHGILFSASDKTATHLYRLVPDTQAIARVTRPDRAMYHAFDFTADFSTFVCSGGDVDAYPEICVSAMAQFQPHAITDYGKQLDALARSTREVISWTSKDGTRIEGVLVKPADFDPSRRYPLLVMIHGGPTGTSRPVRGFDRVYPTEAFVAKGALVLMPNYRGSAGYGAKFRALNVRNLGIGDYWDVISGVDFLIEKGWVDRDRVGSMGWSQGGYISAFLTTYCDRFRAVSVGAGISDWMTYYVNTDIHPFTRQYLKATPWQDPEIYALTSPIHYVDRAKTPTLIQHGERDQRVPIPNAYELYQALKDRKVPTKMYVFEGFGHGITNPKEHLLLMQQNWSWFCRWVWGEAGGAKSEVF